MVRNATAVLLAAAVALTAPAANLEIPASVLAQDARSRAAFTPAERAREAALEARISSKMSINNVNALVKSETVGVAFVVLLAYIKILQKEARDNRRTRNPFELKQKEGKLGLEKEKIEAMKVEAGERFDHAMSAANKEMAMGIVSCAAAAASFVEVNGGTAAKAPARYAVPLATPITVRVVPSKTPTKVPGLKDLVTYETVGKEKGNTVYAFRPGQIVRAEVSQTDKGIFLAVQGSGKCALEAFQELKGKALKTYDYKGPLPTSIQLLSTLSTFPGKYVVRVEGDKSSEGCGGTANASYVYDFRVQLPTPPNPPF